MKNFTTILIASCFCLVSSGNFVFSQTMRESTDRPVSVRPKDKKTDGKKANPGDYFPKDETKSPFRYVIVHDDVRFDNADEGKEKVPVDRFVTILIEERAFNKANLIYLLNNISNYYGDPLSLDIEVHTSLMTLETPEERADMSTHSSRDGFRKFHKTASYSRSSDIFEKCSAGFHYDTGKPGNFVRKYVNLTCATKK
jgi:hypothetical protein